MYTARRLVQLLVACFIALTPVASMVAPARAVVGGYVEVHELGCPPGYSPDALFRDCHENRLPGVDLVADGPGGRHYTDTTDQEGRVVFGDFLEAGPVTVAEAQMTGDYVDYVVFCSRVDNQQPVAVEKHRNGRAAFTVNLPQDIVDAGTGVVCDWYNVPEPLGATTPQPGTTRNGGLGLTRSDWTENYGTPGKVAELLTFENGLYTVAFDRDIATFVEIDLGGGRSLSDAQTAVADLLPADATLAEQYQLPATSGGPIPMLAQRFQSDSLAMTLTRAGVSGDGSMLVLYQFAPEPADGTTPTGSRVTRISIAAGTEPSP